MDTSGYKSLRAALLIVASVVGCVSACRDIRQCFGDLEPFIGTYATYHQIQRSREYLEQKCSLLEDATQCAGELWSVCEERGSMAERDTARELRGEAVAQTYLCDNLNAYMRHQTCLTNTTVQRELIRCQFDWYYIQPTDTPEKICVMLNHDLHCTYTTTTRVCADTAAAEMMYMHELLLNQDMLERYECDHQPPAELVAGVATPGYYRHHPSTTNKPTSQPVDESIVYHYKKKDLSTKGLVAVIFSGLVLLVVVVLVLVFILCRSKHKTLQVGRSHHSSNNNYPHSPPQVTADGSTALENPLYGVNGNGSAVVGGGGDASLAVGETSDRVPIHQHEVNFEKDYTQIDYKTTV